MKHRVHLDGGRKETAKIRGPEQIQYRRSSYIRLVA